MCPGTPGHNSIGVDAVKRHAQDGFYLEAHSLYWVLCFIKPRLFNFISPKGSKQGLVLHVLK